MPLISHRLLMVLRHPLAFTLRVGRGFMACRGLLLSGAIAYYTLLSLIPLIVLILIALSQVFRPEVMADIISMQLQLLTPAQTEALIQQAMNVIRHQAAISTTSIVTLVLFSGLAFKVLADAMHAVFRHALPQRARRSKVMHTLLPYFYVVLLVIGLLIMGVVSSVLELIQLDTPGWLAPWLPEPSLTASILYLLSVAAEIILLSSFYAVMSGMPISLKHAVIGGITATVLWGLVRRGLVWYLANLSSIDFVYGSFASLIIILLSAELLAIILLVGAQVIAEYERLDGDSLATP